MAPQIRDVSAKLSLYKSSESLGCRTSARRSQTWANYPTSAKRRQIWGTFGSRGTLGLLAFCVLLLATALGCGSGQGSSSNPASNPAAPAGGNTNTIAAAGNNVQPVSVSSGPNFVVTTVTVCVPGGACVDVPNVLVDTGSFGLRILASAVPGLALPQSNVAGGPLAECVQFIDNSLVWGSVVRADVKMAGEVASAVPIQLIGDPGLPNIPAGCGTAANAHDNSQTLGSNGILGIGFFVHDCGQNCVLNANLGQYFVCPTPASCAETTVTLADQVQNPVAAFAGADNNGTILELPTVPASGRASVTGSLVFGIGTQANNGLGSATVLKADSTGNFTTRYNGQSFPFSFIDSGSNAIYFLDSAATGFPACSNTGRFGPAVVNFYCPGGSQTLSATHVGINGATSNFSFTVANSEAEFNTGAEALSNIAGPHLNNFDWGLPFFYGRNVYTAIQGASTPAGPGPYWAY